MFENPLIQFAVELLRALLVDAFSQRVRPPLWRWFSRRPTRGLHRALLNVHRRNLKRLMHRLLTESEKDL
jgi:hypothetical protein